MLKKATKNVLKIILATVQGLVVDARQEEEKMWKKPGVAPLGLLISSSGARVDKPPVVRCLLLIEEKKYNI